MGTITGTYIFGFIISIALMAVGRVLKRRGNSGGWVLIGVGFCFFVGSVLAWTGILNL